MRRVVDVLLGDGAFATRAILFDKVKDADRGLRWHQDKVIAVQEQIETPGSVAWSKKSGVWHLQSPVEIMEQILAARIHLGDSSHENGALQVFPGSPRQG